MSLELDKFSKPVPTTDDIDLRKWCIEQVLARAREATEDTPIIANLIFQFIKNGM